MMVFFRKSPEEKARELWEYFRKRYEKPFNTTFLGFQKWFTRIYNEYFKDHSVDEIDWESLLDPALTLEENEQMIKDKIESLEIVNYVTGYKGRKIEHFVEQEKEKEKEELTNIIKRLNEQILALREEIEKLRTETRRIERVERPPELEVIERVYAKEYVTKEEVESLMFMIIGDLVKLGIIEETPLKDYYNYGLLVNTTNFVLKNFKFVEPYLIKPTEMTIVTYMPEKIIYREGIDMKILDRLVRNLATLEAIFGFDGWEGLRYINFYAYNVFNQIKRTFCKIVKELLISKGLVEY